MILGSQTEIDKKVYFQIKERVGFHTDGTDNIELAQFQVTATTEGEQEIWQHWLQ